MSVKIKIYNQGGVITYELSHDNGVSYTDPISCPPSHIAYDQIEDDILIIRTDLDKDNSYRIFLGDYTNVFDENGASAGATAADVYNYLTTISQDATGGGGGSWGGITGEINDQTDLIDLVSEITVAGNLSVSEFNGAIQFNSNATEYYGCDTILKGGVYDRFELPYKNRNTTTGTAYLYAIILDQSDNTIAYKRLSITSGGSANGSFIITFDSPVEISQAGIYQIVLGRRKFNSSSRRVELFHKDVNSSDGRVWVAYSGLNPQLNVDDTSLVDWSTVSKQNFNRIPENLIYKS